jgi:hypothetical protein
MAILFFLRFSLLARLMLMFNGFLLLDFEEEPGAAACAASRGAQQVGVRASRKGALSACRPLAWVVGSWLVRRKDSFVNAY